MALQRKNFRCARDGSNSPIHASSSSTSNYHAGVVISHAELPPRQRKRLQVGSTNLSKNASTADAATTEQKAEGDLSSAARHVCTTNIDLLKATLHNPKLGDLKQELKERAQSSMGTHVVRTEQRRLRSMTPSSSASRMGGSRSNNIQALDNNSQETGVFTETTAHDDASHQDNKHHHHRAHDSNKTRQMKQRALFLANRKKLYEAFVEKYGSMRAVFKAFDSDGDGVISFQRFQKMVEASEVGLTLDETREMYTQVDTNGDNAMEYQEFAQMFTSNEISKDAGYLSPMRESDGIASDPSSSLMLKYRSPLELSPRSRERMKALRSQVTEQLANKHGLEVNIHGGKNEQLLMYAFKQFDMDNDGVLTYGQVKQALGKDYLKLQMSPHDMEEMIRMIDRNGDELISMKEFVQYFGVGKREIPTDMLDDGRKKALVILHQKMNAPLTPREEFDPEYFQKRHLTIDNDADSDMLQPAGCLPENLSKRIAAASIFQTPPSFAPSMRLRGSKSVPSLGSIRGSEYHSSTSGRVPEVNTITPVSQDRFLHRRMERTDWTRVGFGGDGIVADSALFLLDHDRFRTTTAEAYTPMCRGMNSGELFRDQKTSASADHEECERIRHARLERTQQNLQQMDANRAKEERFKDWKVRANVRKHAGERFTYLERIHDQEQRVGMKGLQTQKRHGGARFLRMWAGSADSQFNDPHRAVSTTDT
uniref:EF-hand domain-containing protein n=1 Tax=Globisporangium ultimum (strain ATCC 200006 / CBS 805.95 / DAOM BR144) TaxID=431595 RepID=K3WJR9_GLOUD